MMGARATPRTGGAKRSHGKSSSGSSNKHKKDKKKKTKKKKHSSSSSGKKEKKHHKRHRHQPPSAPAPVRTATPGTVGPRDLHDEALRNEEVLGAAPDTLLTEADYFSRSPEFRLWLREERNVFFDDLDGDEARRLFAKFVARWNDGKLKSMRSALFTHARTHARMHTHTHARTAREHAEA
jgi:hypothetical protein